jgi:hypothetical protein
MIKVNLGTFENSQNVKINEVLEFKGSQALTTLLWSSRTYLPRSKKILKGIPPKIAQHHIKFDTPIPPTHQAKYMLSLNYVVITKQYTNKLLTSRLIQLVKEVTWLPPIVVVSKKNGKS